MTGDCKIVLDLPTSYKGWKERFVWIEGDDSNLGCSLWPEINKEALDPQPLSAEERRALDMVASYTGPRLMEVLLDRSVLRVHGISSVPPTQRDEARATSLTVGGGAEVPLASEMTPSEESADESQAAPLGTSSKRPRGETAAGSVPLSPQPAEVAGDVASGGARGFFRTRQKKMSIGPCGTRRLGQTSDAPMEVESADSGSDLLPPSPTARGGSVPETTQEEPGTRSGTGSPSGGARKQRRPGKEPLSGQERPSLPRGWPTPYYLAESRPTKWADICDVMIGQLSPGGDHEKDPDSEHIFVPDSRMDVRSSVFKSPYSQAKVVEQFRLPRDREMLSAIPDLGLHAILRSYLTRGCLVEDELHSRLARGHHAYERLRKAQMEGNAPESAEFDRVVGDLSAKQAELDVWRREMEVKEALIADLKASDSRKSAEIQQLKQKLQHAGTRTGSPGSVEDALRERDRATAQLAVEKQIAAHARSQLEEEVTASRGLREKCAKLEKALDLVESERWTADEGLRERCVQLQKALSLAESEVSYLKSSAYETVVLERGKPDIIEEFRQSVDGKTEVALACKAGSDYVMGQLSAEQRGSPGRLRYPPIIADYVDVLTDIENAGGGYPVEKDDGGGGGESPSSRSSVRSTGSDDT